jgi:signal transduction histidine kinase
MKRLPIRIRLTTAFALAMVAVLAGVGLFVYVRMRMDLDESIDLTLSSRSQAAEQLLADTGGLAGFPIEEIDEAFVQLIDSDGAVLDQVGQVHGNFLTPAELSAGQSGALVIERPVAGIETTARMLVRPLQGRLLVVGQALAIRDEPLSDLLTALLIGGPLAVLAASVAGYGLARAGLSPVDAIRATAAEISQTGDGTRLPVPLAEDEIRRLAETLNQMIDRLEGSVARERRFVTDASHELRTPIAIVKTELEAALLADDLDPEVATALRSAVDELDSLAQLAEDLLVIARTSESGLPLQKSEFAVMTVLEDVRARYIDRSERHGRAIRVSGDSELVATIDPLRIRQAISNLVDNSLRYGVGTVTLNASSSPGWVHVDVSDEGIGFPAELRGRAFERFAIGDPGRTQSGTGLGLAIVQSLVEAHDGTAEILDIRPTTVRISLPVSN